ncbi:MAG: ankyrin repeat domain-containing protein [Rhabdochlamydiaceae bacterium]
MMSISPVSSSVNKSVPSESNSSLRYLDWTQRPYSLKKSISNAFESLLKQDKSNWGVCNGSGIYNMCGVNEQALMKKMIQQHPDRKNFYALDIGAGDFQWSKGLANYIEKQTDLPKDIKVHIIGVRGERYLGNRVVGTERYKIYNLGAFKIEELFEEFKEGRLDLQNKVDLIVSHWCFRHFADPVGTFVQTYNLLRPKTGFLLLDGFFFETNTNLDEMDGNRRLTQLFLDIKTPFLTNYHQIMNSSNHFMVQRVESTPCQLPMSYLGSRDPGHGWQIGSDCVTQFSREPQEADKEGFHLPSAKINDYNFIYGNKRMYDWLKKNRLLVAPSNVWRPLQDKDNDRALPSLHRAILQGELQQVKEFLDRGDDIDESDSAGCTPLHIAIQKQCDELFELLLSKGADIGLPNGEGHTLLHQAAISDTEGRCLQTLINNGAEVNVKSISYETPLDCAIKAKNLKAIEILIKAGANISKESQEDLTDPAFSSLFMNEGLFLQRLINNGFFI